MNEFVERTVTDKASSLYRSLLDLQNRTARAIEQMEQGQVPLASHGVVGDVVHDVSRYGHELEQILSVANRSGLTGNQIVAAYTAGVEGR